MSIGKKVIALLMTGALMLALVPLCSATGEQSSFDGYIVRLNDSARAKEIMSLYSDTNYAPGMYVVENRETVDMLSSLGVVESSGPNYVMSLQEVYSTDQWNLNTIDAQTAWNHEDIYGEYDCRGDGITVAIIDSGVYPHQDLNLSHFLDVPEQYQGYKSWHGTAVAGIIAAQLNGMDVDGIAPNVNVMSLCVTDEYGKTNSAVVISAMDYAVENGADIINISIGGTERDELLDDACKRASEQGVIVVAAAGNYSGNATKSSSKYMYPASNGYTVSVSSCMKFANDVVFDSSYSFFNDAVTVCAPGTNIVSLYTQDQTNAYTGTSFASPTITAAAALAKQYDRSIGLTEFVDLLAATSTDLGDPGWDVYYGCGVVNIGRLIEKLDEMYPASEGPEPVEEQDPEEDPAEEQPTPAPAEETGRAEILPPANDEHSTTETVPEPEEEPEALPFTDIDSHWAHQAIEFVFRNNLMNGTDDVTFQPDKTLSRAMLVMVLYRLAGEPETASSNTFSDVAPGAWYERAVIWAAEKGIVNGNGDGTFLPQADITREQMAAMLLRFAESQGLYEERTADLSVYQDAENISAWALSALEWAIAEGLITGRTPETIVPRGTATRAEAATILMRFCNALHIH